MKQGSFRAVRRLVFLLVILSFSGFFAFGQQTPVDLRSIDIDPFDGRTTHTWEVGGRTQNHEFEWMLDASRFATRGFDDSGNELNYPLRTFVPSFPMVVYRAVRENRDIRSFGINGSFDRPGYNWIDVYPATIDSIDRNGDPTPFEIPLPGLVRTLDMWVWGSNLRYTLEAYVRDYRGVVHRLEMGDLAFQGWRNMQVHIPNHIRQTRRVLPSYAGLHFIKFRIWTTPGESVNNFYVYFNQFKILTDVFDPLFDGDELADPVRVQEMWMQN